MPARHYSSRLLGAMVLLLGLSSYAAGQGTPPTARAHEDSVKGRIWTATAHRLWRVAPQLPRTKLPKWDTAVEFDAWLKTGSGKKLAKESGLDMLKGAVLDSVKARNNGKSNGTSKQVAQAILHTVAKEQSKPGNVRRIAQIKEVEWDSLRKDLQPYVQFAPRQAATGNQNDLAAAKAANNPSSETTEPSTEPQTVYVTKYRQPLGMPLWTFSALLLAAGTVVGAAGYRMLAGWPKHSTKFQKQTSTPLELPSEMRPAESNELKRKNHQLRGDVNRLQREVDELKAQLTRLLTPSVPAPVAATSVVTPAAIPAPVSSVAAQPSTTLYGPVQETPFVEERKFVERPLPQLALMLTVNPHTPDQASFTLNPQVDQSMLIGDGLSRLQQFFDYDMPAGRINAVTAAGPGQLQRQTGGWQVVTRARLHVR